MQSRNSYDLSVYSEELPILCGFVPDAPAAPVTSIENDQAVVTWTAPYDNGTPITSYTITVRDSTDQYIVELTDCDGSDSQIVSD